MERTKLVDGFVYLITNSINKKQYVGITTRPISKRISEHIYDSSNKSKKPKSQLHKSISKYGIDNFNINILEEFKSNSVEFLLSFLCSREIYYIQKYRTNIDGYNLTIGGCGCTGYKHTDRTKLKMSQFQKGKKLSDEHKEAIRKFMNSENNPNLGRKLTEETKIKIGAANKGKLLGKTNPMYGKKRPDLSKRNKASGIKICQINIDSGDIVKTWDSLRECAQKTGWNRKCISDCCNGISKQSHGFIWKYEEVFTCNT